MLVMARTKAGVAIQARIGELELSQGDVARIMGRSQSWVSQSLLDNADKTLRRMWIDSPTMFKQLLSMLDWDFDQFRKETGVNFSAPLPTPNVFTDEASLDVPNLQVATKLIPRYDLLSAGQGGDGGNIVDYIDIPESWQGKHAAYIVSGDSMAPRVPDKATVIVRCQDYASPHNIIVCFTPAEGMLVKYLKEITSDGIYVLLSFNPNYDPIWAKEVDIKGVVREVRTPVEIINGNHHP